jgi:photosystem II stability/assembly factor-like uncharacterized protein
MLRHATAGALAAAALISITTATESWKTDDHGHRARSAADVPVAHDPGAKSSLLGGGWGALGPFGGDVADVSVSPVNTSIVLAGIAPSSGTSGTMYRSTDAGATWTEVAALSGGSVYDIEFDPSGKVYIGTINSVWTSTDDGVTWTQQNLGIGLNDQVFEVTIDPNDATRIWAGVADAMGSQTQNILLSTDSGVSWTDMTPAGGAGMSGYGIALDPTDSNKVYAAFGGSFSGGAFWVSADGGGSWTNRSAGLPGNPLKDVAHDGTRVLVTGGQLFGSQTVGLFTSSNDGATWTALHDGTWPNLVLHDIELDPADSNTIYLASAGSGIYKSADGGASWIFGMTGATAFSLNEVCVDPSGGTPIYVGGASVGIWKSSDGIAFLPSSVGIGSLTLKSVAANSLDHDELAVAFEGLNNGGVYTSTDGGMTWDIANLPGTRYSTVLFAPDGTLYAISDGPSTIAPEGLYRRDSIGSWTGLGPDQGTYFESELVGLAFSENDPNLIVSGGSDFGYAGHEATVWVSTDGGATWNKNYEATVSSGDVLSVAILPDGTDSNMIASYTDFSGTAHGGVLVSTDGGLTWAMSNSGLAAEAQCYDLGISHFDSDTIFVADGDYPTGAICRSTDGGASWTAMGYTGRSNGLVTDPNRPLRLYITSWTGGKVQYSDDGGATFTDLDDGLASAGSLSDLTLVPGGACHRLLVASGTGAYSEAAAACTLEPDNDTISVTTGGVVNMSLAAGQANAGYLYLILGSATGTAGIPVGAINVPLTWDWYTDLTLSQANVGIYGNTFGVLDGDGMAAASITVSAGADPALIGMHFWYAGAAFGIGPLDPRMATNAIEVVIVP